MALWLCFAPACWLFDYEILNSVRSGPTGDCTNQALDGDETDLDCGGDVCGACSDGAGCNGSGDCASSSCIANTCRPMTCSDQVQNAGETGVDCGGGCPPCGAGIDCAGAADCASANCLGNVCQAASCSDGILNQDEAGIDCGGLGCGACPSCSDGTQNQDETGVDCGGSACGLCAAAGCAGPSDCASANCLDNVCQAASCSDGVLNQDETGIDCGASCAACASCSDGIQNQDEMGVDCGGAGCAACGVNTPPLARMLVTPGAGSHDGAPATLFQGDGSSSTDREDPPGELSYAWDWDGDGVTDATGVSATYSYVSAGVFEARLTVQDSGGLRATATFLVIVNGETNILRVTTAVDEDEPGATPASPGGSGLSLREAIDFANTAAGRQTVLVPSGFVIALTQQLPSPADALGLDIVGDGAVLDGAGAGPADDCIGMTTPQNRIFGFEIQNCNRSPLRLAFGAAGSEFSRLNIHDNAQPVILNDVNVVFGPDNEVSRSGGYCVSVLGNDATVIRNYVHDCSRGFDLTGSSSGTLVIGNVVANCGTGMLFGNGASNLTVVHNTVHGSSADGILAGTVNSGMLLRNNILSNSSSYGLRANDGVFSANDHNNYFGNVVGTCTNCSTLGAGSLLSDPLFIDLASNDFRLQPGSPNIDTGVDTGHDVNGPGSGDGLFNGANPDIGAKEAP